MICLFSLGQNPEAEAEASKRDQEAPRTPHSTPSSPSTFLKALTAASLSQSNGRNFGRLIDGDIIPMPWLQNLLTSTGAELRTAIGSNSLQEWVDLDMPTGPAHLGIASTRVSTIASYYSKD